MTEPILTLAQMVAEMAAMSRDQAALSRQQLGALRARAERQTQLLEAVMERSGEPPGGPAIAGIQLHRLNEQDDPQSFLDMFEATASACGWPEEEWRAVLDQLGLSPEDPRRRFRGAQLGPEGRPFAYAQQLRDAATRWLQPGEAAGEQRLVETVVQEQFVAGLPDSTSDWVRCHRPADLAMAVTRPGHFRRECPLMEVGQLIRVVGPPAPSPGPRGTYSVPRRLQVLLQFLVPSLEYLPARPPSFTFWLRTFWILPTTPPRRSSLAQRKIKTFVFTQVWRVICARTRVSYSIMTEPTALHDSAAHLQNALLEQGALIGRHDSAISNMAQQQVSMIQTLNQLSQQMQELNAHLSAPPKLSTSVNPTASSKAPVSRDAVFSTPEPFAGDLDKCKGFVLQCSLVFGRSPQSFPDDASATLPSA
ncbi:uncharacterized protein ACNS7B_008488 [Menidia menidia]